MSEQEVVALPDRSNALVGQNVVLKPISEIKISKRQRKIDPNDKKGWARFEQHITGLAASIQRNGLFHPITLEDESDELVAGFCRLQAYMKLGRSEIPSVRRKDLSPLDRKVIEAEENLQRLGLEWWEEQAAIAEIHELQGILAAERGETWTQKDTAAMTNRAVGTVNQALQVSAAIKTQPELKQAKGLVAALNKVETGKKIEKRKEQQTLRDAGRIKTYPAEILVGDALELIKAQEDASFDAVITNFPFGVELTIGKDHEKPYADEEDYIVKLVRAVTHESYRVLRNDSWMVGFFDMRKITYSNKMKQFVKEVTKILDGIRGSEYLDIDVYNDLMQLGAESLGLTSWMEEAGFKYVQLLPAVWVKPNKTQGMIGDPRKGMIVAFEAFVFAAKGDAILLKQGLQNIFIYDTPSAGERDLSIQMPVDLCKRLVEITCLGGARILDPFAGSGAVGEGALENQCSFLGFELDPKRAEIGNLRLREHVFAQEKKG